VLSQKTLAELNKTLTILRRSLLSKEKSSIRNIDEPPRKKPAQTNRNLPQDPIIKKIAEHFQASAITVIPLPPDNATTSNTAREKSPEEPVVAKKRPEKPAVSGSQPSKFLKDHQHHGFITV